MPKRYPRELRERTVRLVIEHRGEYATEYAAIPLDRGQAGHRDAGAAPVGPPGRGFGRLAAAVAPGGTSALDPGQWDIVTDAAPERTASDPVALSSPATTPSCGPGGMTPAGSTDSAGLTRRRARMTPGSLDWRARVSRGRG